MAVPCIFACRLISVSILLEERNILRVGWYAGLGQRVVAGALVLATAACHTSDPDAKPSASAASSVGVLNIHVPTLRSPPDGFEACHDDFAHERDRLAVQSALVKLRKTPPMPSLVASRGFARRKGKTGLSIAAGTRHLTVELGRFAKLARVTKAGFELLEPFPGEPRSFPDLLLDALLPKAAIVAQLADDWHGTTLKLRFYLIARDAKATAEALNRDGRKILRTVACAQQDDAYHRAAYRANRSSAEAPNYGATIRKVGSRLRRRPGRSSMRRPRSRSSRSSRTAAGSTSR
jgi:hypothetical protein